MKKIKKDLMFTIPLIIIGVMLFMLRLTNLPVHIVLSVVGAITLVIYTIIMKKDWKLKPVEILMRFMYGIALISGAVVMNIKGILFLSVIHKLSAALFVIFLIGLLIHKIIKNK